MSSTKDLSERIEQLIGLVLSEFRQLAQQQQPNGWERRLTVERKSNSRLALVSIIRLMRLNFGLGHGTVPRDGLPAEACEQHLTVVGLAGSAWDNWAFCTDSFPPPSRLSSAGSCPPAYGTRPASCPW